MKVQVAASQDEFARVEQPALERIAAFAVDLRAASLPAEVLSRTKDCVLDALSACLTAGSTLESRCALAIAASPGDEATLIGMPAMATASGAAFFNGTTAASTSRSDTHPASATHPGTVVIPAAFAAAEASGASGAVLVEAIVAGYETMCRLGAALVTPEFAAIFRPTGMVGPTAGGIAAGRAMGLAPKALSHAGSLATQTASGLNEWAHAATPELPFHSGFAARNAVDAALLARAGAMAASTALEGRAGLLAGFAALERAPLLTRGLGDEFKMLEVGHKPAPACIYVQTPCQLARRIAREHDLEPAHVRSIEIRVSRAAAAYPGCDDNSPIEDPQAAKLSIQFAVASVLVAGGIFDANWRDFRNAAANALSAKATVVVDDTMADASGRQGAAIRVVLEGGGIIVEAQHAFIPMTQEDLYERFMSVALPRLGRDASECIVDRVARLESLREVRELTALLRTQA